MQTFRLSLSILALCVVGIVLTSCKDDDEVAPAKPKLSFAESSLVVSEDQGLIEIEVTLDNPAPENLTIDYELSGTALDVIRAGTSASPDYQVLGDADYGEIEIAKGETTGTITLGLYADFYLEGTETINIELVDANTTNVEISNNDDITIELDQESSGLLVVLEWTGPNEETPGIADMDMFLWIGETSSTVEDIVAGSFNESYEPAEFIFIPASIQDYYYGLSYNYYRGNLSPLNFTVTFVEYVDGEEVSTNTYDGTYTDVNENLWDEKEDTYYSTIIAQTFENDGGEFTNFSSITTPEAGSRLSNSRTLIPAKLHMKK